MSEHSHGIEPLITIEEFAAILKIAERTLYTRIADGRVPAPIREPGFTRWEPSIIREWIKAGCPPQDKFEQ